MKSCFLFLVLQFAVLSVSGQKNAVKPDGVSIIRGSGNAEQVEAVSNAEETDTVMEEEPDNALIARNLSRTLLTSYSRLKFNSGAMTGIQAKVNHNNSYSVLHSPAVTVVLEVQSQNLDFESFFEAEKDFLSKSTVYTQLKTALSQCEQTCVHSDVDLIPHSSFLLPNEDVSDSVTLRWKIKNKDASKNVPVDAFGVFLYSNDGDRLVEILEPIATLSRSWVLFDLFTSRSKSYDKAIALISELRNQFFQNLQHPMSCRAESDGFTLPSDILTSAETPTVQKCTKNNLTYRGVESKSAMVLSQTTTVENRKPRNLLDVEFLQILFLHFSVTQSVLSAQPNATISVVIGMTSKTKAVRSMSMRIPLRVLTSTRFCQASEEHFECGYTQTFAAPNDLKEITILALVPPSVTLYEAVMVHMQLSKPDGLALYQEILLERDMDLALSTYNWDQEEENWLVLANSNQDSQTTYSEEFVIKNVPPLYDALLQLYKLEQVVIHHDVTLPPESFDLYNVLPEEVFNEHQELDLSETDVSLTDASEQLNVLDEELEQMKKTSQNWKSEIQNINDEVKALNEIQGVYKNKQTLAQEFVTRSKSVDELLVQLREQNVSLQQQMSDFKDKFDEKKGSIEEERAEVEGLISSLSEKQKEVSDLYSKTNSALETQFQRAQDLLKNAQPQPTPIMPSWAAGLISFFTTSTVILLASILFFTFKKPSLLPAPATDASLHNTHGRGDGDEEIYDQLS